jgi:hypothetical protein
MGKHSQAKKCNQQGLKVAVTLLCHILEVPGSNLGVESG